MIPIYVYSTKNSFVLPEKMKMLRNRINKATKVIGRGDGATHVQNYSIENTFLPQWCRNLFACLHILYAISNASFDFFRMRFASFMAIHSLFLFVVVMLFRVHINRDPFVFIVCMVIFDNIICPMTQLLANAHWMAKRMMMAMPF